MYEYALSIARVEVDCGDDKEFLTLSYAGRWLDAVAVGFDLAQ
jgi:hypothetical protein